MSQKFKGKIYPVLIKIGYSLFSRYDKYFMKELLPNYFFGIVFFTFILMLNELFFLAKLYVQFSVPISHILLLLVNMIPFLMSYSIPIAILPAYLLTMGRLSQESELIAFKSCGVSFLRLIRPGIIFGVLISLFAVVFMDSVVIPANIAWIKLRAKVIAQKPAVELKQNDMVQLGGYKITFDTMQKENNADVLYKIHMVDIDSRKTIEAEKGRFYIDPENPEHYIIKFLNGSITEVVKMNSATNHSDEKFFVTSFRYLSIHCYIDLPQEYFTKGPDSMKIDELLTEINTRSKEPMEKIAVTIRNKQKIEQTIEQVQKNYNIQMKSADKATLQSKALEMANQIKPLQSQMKDMQKAIAELEKNLPQNYIMKLYDKFALPLASFVFALLSVSIGMYTARSGRNEGLGISIIIVILFYGFKNGTELLIMKQVFPPYMEWGPDIFFLIIGSVLMIQKIRE